jgi:iron(III) transport system substrate-binding protein
VGLIPNQESWGTHVNIAGGAVARNSSSPAAAVRFLEYLSGDAAQAYFANGNSEYPVVRSVHADNPALAEMGSFKSAVIPISVVAVNSAKAR